MDFLPVVGLLLPFLGTSLGALCVLFMRRRLSRFVSCASMGFAGGVMVAASVWSLLIPAVEQSAGWGVFSFVPAVSGFFIGIFSLFGTDRILSRFLTVHAEPPPSPDKTPSLPGHGSALRRTWMLVLAVTLHNIPEGMAVGVVYAGLLTGQAGISAMGAFALSLGIAVQNFPEGAIVSMPLKADGMGKPKACLFGILSGIVEPIGAAVTLLAADRIIPALPFLLGFAAGAMIFVVVRDLIPGSVENGLSGTATVCFSVGFALMMILDITLG